MLDDISIAGGWLGTYRWGGLHCLVPPVRFEASIVATGEGFAGEILDAAFPGLALIDGCQRGREVRFTKTYTAASRVERTLSADYQGEISEDGRHLKGTWRIKIEGRKINLFTVHGSWEARRTWDENAEPNERSKAAGVESHDTLTIDARMTS